MRLFAVLICAFFVAFPVFAQVSEQVEPSQPQLPSCSDPKLLDQVHSKIVDSYKKVSSQSLIEKRIKKLTLSNLKNFKEKDINNYKDKKHRIIANKLITVKVSNGLTDEDLRLCSTPENSALPVIYLLIYPENYYYMVDILNFTANPKEDFFVIYN